MYRRTATECQVLSSQEPGHRTPRVARRTVDSGFRVRPGRGCKWPGWGDWAVQLTEVPPADRGDAGNLGGGLPATARLLLSIMTTAPDGRLAAPKPWSLLGVRQAGHAGPASGPGPSFSVIT